MKDIKKGVWKISLIFLQQKHKQALEWSRHTFKKNKKYFLDNKQNRQQTHCHSAMWKYKLVPKYIKVVESRSTKWPQNTITFSWISVVGNVSHWLLQRCTRKEYLHTCPICYTSPRCYSWGLALLGRQDNKLDSPAPQFFTTVLAPPYPTTPHAAPLWRWAGIRTKM